MKNWSRSNGRSCMLVPRGESPVSMLRWEWQEDRRDAWVPGFFKYQTALVASLDVRSALDVEKPSVVKDTCIHGDPRPRSGRTSRGDDGLLALIIARRRFVTHGAWCRAVWRLKSFAERWPKTYCGKAEWKWKAEGWGNRVRRRRR